MCAMSHRRSLMCKESNFCGWSQGVGGVLLAALVILGGCTVTVVPRGEYVVRPRPYYAPAPVVVVQPQPVATVTVAPVAEASAEPDAALQGLVAPIALYPDPLIAEILPACTYPDQVQAANQWVQANPNAAQADIDAQNWDPSIKSLAHYPTVLAYMAGEPQWMQSLGSAFSDNQANVFEAIQDLRVEAKNNGNLTSTMYMDVTTDGATVSIQPADPEVVYVPAYDPVLVYQGAAVITFGPRYASGVWLVQGVDWDGGVVFVGDWHGGWVYRDHGWFRDRLFHGYDHRWGHDDRWGRRPFVERDHWAVRHEVAVHGKFALVHRAPERVEHVQKQVEHARTVNKAVASHANTNRPAANNPAGNRPAANSPTGNRPAANSPTGNKPAANPSPTKTPPTKTPEKGKEEK